MEDLKRDVAQAAESTKGIKDLDQRKLWEALEKVEKSEAQGMGEVATALREAGMSQEQVNEFLRFSSGAQDGAQEAGEEVIPEPGFVVKAVDSENCKVFINVCGSERLPVPGGWEGGKMPLEVKEHLDQLEKQGGETSETDPPEAMRFPLSCDAGRWEEDKQGNPTRTHDVMVNMDILRQAFANKRFKAFLSQLAISWVGQKAAIELKDTFSLPRRKYVGAKVQSQRVRSNSNQHGHAGIEEISTDSEPSFPLPAEATPAHSSSSQWQERYERYQKPPVDASQSDLLPRISHSMSFVGKPCQGAQLTLEVPGEDPDAIRVAVVGEEVRIACAGRAPTSVALPFHVDSDSAYCETVEGSSSSMLVWLPYRPYSEVVEEFWRSERPRDEGSLSLASSSLDDLE